MGRYSSGDARALYEEIGRHTDIVGHAACGNPFEESVLQFRQRTTDVAQDFVMEENPASDTEDGPPRMRFHVASPWHALIHLTVNNRGWLEGKQGPIRTPLIYRGQRDCHWSLVPSLSRKDTDREKEERRLLDFCAVVRRVFAAERASSIRAELSGTEVLSDAVLEATAQHYGIRTKLLDFTSDPAVAVWFACQGGAAGDIGSVFALPMTMGSLFDMGVILCHPLALRPHRQHGLFIHDSLNYLKRLLIEVRFPIDPEFRIIRDRLPAILLAEDEWWTAIVSASDGPPASSEEPRDEVVDESLLHMLQMLMELTTFDVERNTSFNHNVVAEIARANGGLLLACEQRCRAVAARHFRGTMGQYIVPQLLNHLVKAALR